MCIRDSIRDNSLQKEPTVGQVPLVSGEIAEDLDEEVNLVLLEREREDAEKKANPPARSGRSGWPWRRAAST